MSQENPNTASLYVSDSNSRFEQQVEANELNLFLSVYKSLLNLGADSVQNPKDKRYIRVTNFISINYFIGSLVYLSFALFLEKWQWFYATGSFTLMSLAVLFLNGFGKTNFSRVAFIFGTNALVFIQTLIAGKESLGLNYFFIAVIFPFLIYDIRQFVMVAIGILIPLVYLYLFDTVEPYFKAYNLSHAELVVLASVSIVLQFILIITSVYQFVFYNRKAERELETSNAQMMMQTSELKRSNSDLEQFAYIISHDLKAPVRNISSFMNLLVNKYGTTLNPEAREFVQYSQTGAKRLERLIDDILAYSRLGTNLPKPIPVNLNDVVSTIRFESHDRLVANNGKININKELPVVNNVHSSLMYHVFKNLINNGLKFNKSAIPEININWTNSLNYYTFTVSDNGIGISKEYSATIFQMFKRLHNENEYDGTGIGLAICKKIVEYYHGEIWFESEEGKGTMFHFTIRKF